jgi:transposase-like protein
MAKKNWTPEDRERVVALIREIKQDVQQLREQLEALRQSKR